jgi:hypothetical protein
MRDDDFAPARCANAPCPRPAEPGDAYCAPCGLERSLFTRRGGEADRSRRADTEGIRPPQARR